MTPKALCGHHQVLLLTLSLLTLASPLAAALNQNQLIATLSILLLFSVWGFCIM